MKSFLRLTAACMIGCAPEAPENSYTLDSDKQEIVDTDIEMLVRLSPVTQGLLRHTTESVPNMYGEELSAGNGLEAAQDYATLLDDLIDVRDTGRIVWMNEDDFYELSGSSLPSAGWYDNAPLRSTTDRGYLILPESFFTSHFTERYDGLMHEISHGTFEDHDPRIGELMSQMNVLLSEGKANTDEYNALAEERRKVIKETHDAPYIYGAATELSAIGMHEIWTTEDPRERALQLVEYGVEQFQYGRDPQYLYDFYQSRMSEEVYSTFAGDTVDSILNSDNDEIFWDYIDENGADAGFASRDALWNMHVLLYTMATQELLSRYPDEIVTETQAEREARSKSNTETTHTHTKRFPRIR